MRAPSPSKAAVAYFAFTIRQEVITRRTRPAQGDRRGLQPLLPRFQFAPFPKVRRRRMPAAALRAMTVPLPDHLRTRREPIRIRAQRERDDPTHLERSDPPNGASKAFVVVRRSNEEDDRFAKRYSPR